MKKLVCRLLGHSWKWRSTTSTRWAPEAPWRSRAITFQCRRCKQQEVV